MRRYVAGRLLLMIPTLVGVAILTFVIMRAVPGDIVALKYAGSPVPQSVIDEERHQLGLDKPMWAQFTDWMGEIAHFDLGTSLWTGHPVVDEILVRFPLSIELAIIATLLAITIAIPLGVLAAVRQDTWTDYAIRLFSIGGLAMPSFWIGLLMVLATITFFGWAPPLVFTAITDDPIANLSQMVLPALFFFQAEAGIRVDLVTGVQTCALPISTSESKPRGRSSESTRRPRPGGGCRRVTAEDKRE